MRFNCRRSTWEFGLGFMYLPGMNIFEINFIFGRLTIYYKRGR